MKLLTHNMLACHIKGVKNGFPFKIEAHKVVERDADFNPGTVDAVKPICNRL
jgi:multifunctional methyltransferase subunit TRM112